MEARQQMTEQDDQPEVPEDPPTRRMSYLPAVPGAAGKLSVPEEPVAGSGDADTGSDPLEVRGMDLLESLMQDELSDTDSTALTRQQELDVIMAKEKRKTRLLAVFAATTLIAAIGGTLAASEAGVRPFDSSFVDTIREESSEE